MRQPQKNKTHDERCRLAEARSRRERLEEDARGDDLNALIPHANPDAVQSGKAPANRHVLRLSLGDSPAGSPRDDRGL
jgi:hypothetical protein